MVTTDLDGTLLDSRGRLSRCNRATLEALGAAGVLRVVATGRNLHSALQAMAPDLPIDYLVFASGAGVLDWPSRRLLHRQHLDDRDALQAAAHLREVGLDFMLHQGVPDNHRFWFCRAGAHNADFERRLRRYEEHCTPWPEADPQGPFSQLLAVQAVNGAPDAGRARHDALVEALDPLTVIRTTSPLDHRSCWFEVFAQGVSKATGAAWVLERHGLARDTVLAVGNDYNDEALLEWAPHSRVVANAPHGLRARFQTVPSNDDDGFTAAVRAWLALLA